MGPSLKIGNHDNGERLDAVLARTYPQYSRAFFQKFLRKGGATLSGAPREPDYRVRVGELFQVADFESFATEPVSVTGPGSSAGGAPEILFEDAALLVIDKPAGLVVHPAPGHRVGTLMDWLKRHLGPSVLKVFTDPERLGLVHRLDKDTSGVLVIAKSIVAQTAISRQFHDRTVQKTYTAFVEGVPSAKTGVINAPVGRSRKVPTRMAISPLGRESETVFEVKETLQEVSQVSLYPKTGRTHQIRVHLSAIGHPVVGDRTYGSKSIWAQDFDIHRPLLHAERLKLLHPTTQKSVTFEAPWPADFHQAQKRFRAAFKILFILIAAGGLLAAPAQAEEAATHRTTAAAGPSLSTQVRRLKQEVADLKERIDQVAASVEKYGGFEDRLRDLERAVSDLNGKAVGSSANTEETKTQLLDISRKLKGQQDTLDQLRDQLDRMNRQVIRLQSTPPPSVPAPEPVKGNK